MKLIVRSSNLDRLSNRVCGICGNKCLTMMCTRKLTCWGGEKFISYGIGNDTKWYGGCLNWRLDIYS